MTLRESGHHWFLEDVEEAHAQSGGRFRIPSRDEREAILVGAQVKLIFLIPDWSDGGLQPVYQGERIWVTVNRTEGVAFAGALHTAPVTECPLSAGSVVEFGPEHIATIMLNATDPRHPLYSKTALGRLWRKLVHFFGFVKNRGESRA